MSDGGIWIMKNICLYFFLFIFLLPVYTSANDLYVDIDSIGGSCSDTYTKAQNNISHPFCTIARTIAQETAGDTIYIRAGIYSEGELTLLTSGSSTSSKITWKNYPGEAPVIKAMIRVNAKNYRRFEGQSTSNRLTFDGNSTNNYGIYSNAGDNQYVEVVNCEIKNYLLNGIYFSNCTNYTVEGTYIHHIGDNSGVVNHGDGFLVSGISSGIFKSSEVYHCDDDCITMNTGTVIDNVIVHHCIRPVTGSAHADCIEGGSGTIKNSTIYDCENAGIITGKDTDLVSYNNVFYRTGVDGNNWIQLRGCNSATICNNTLYNSAFGGIRAIDSDDHLSKARNITIYNNIFHTMNRLSAPIQLGNGTIDEATYVSDYNVFYGMDSAKPTIIYSYEGVDMNLNDMYVLGQEQHSISGLDPSFQNTIIYDFHLKENSCARNTGTTLTSFSVDKDGITRPQGSAWDIGAYEYNGGNNTSMIGVYNAKGMSGYYNANGMVGIAPN